MLEEFWYRKPPTLETQAKVRERLDQALRALLECEHLWEEVRAAGPGDVRIADPFGYFALEMPESHSDVRVYAAPDLVVRPDPRGPYIITDLKTGCADGVIDQLLMYAVALRHQVPRDEPFEVIGQVIALRAPANERVLRVRISADDIDAAVAQTRRNIRALQRLTVDSASNIPLPATDFPRASQPGACRYCRFRGVCWPDRYPLGEISNVSATAVSET